MANHLSTVIIVSVKIDKCDANTVNQPAVLHPIPLSHNNDNIILLINNDDEYKLKICFLEHT